MHLIEKYVESGTISYSNETDIISITNANTAGFVHEVTHAAQYEFGEIGFAADGATIGQDVFDEIEAYCAQYAFKPSIVTNITSSIGVKRISDITIDWLQNINIGGKQPYIIGNENNTGISTININSGYDEIVKAYPALINSIDRTKSLKDYMYKYKSL